uniref:ZP domain-containing protein n=1 Tax=Elaeophora elaphi TaxID=1147741 RepID=A0A0R3RN08_9BILA
MYFEINVTVPIITHNSTNRRISVLFRMKYYVRADEYALVGDPYVYHDDFGCATKKLHVFCSRCN